MRKLLFALVAALALTIVSMPGVAVARKGGNDELVRLCRQEHRAIGYKNQGHCVSIQAKGPFDAFEAACGGFAGDYTDHGTLFHGQPVAPMCAIGHPWTDPRLLFDVITAFRPICAPRDAIADGEVGKTVLGVGCVVSG